MALFSFGEYVEGKGFKTVDEHEMRSSATIMLILAIIAFTNGFILHHFEILPFITGLMMANFFIGVFINPKFAPTIVIARIFNRKAPLPIGAIQKRFAWSLGFILTLITFVLTLLLQDDLRFFEPVCMLCIICMTLVYFESVMGICLGCKLYHAALALGVLKEPKERPTCMGDSCNIPAHDDKNVEP